LLEQSADSSSSLYGCADADAGYVVSGYSFGGYTAYAVGGALVDDASGDPTLDLSDSRVTAIITFAPWNAFSMLGAGTADITVPVMTIGGQEDATVGTQYLDLFDPIEGTPRLLGDFDNVGHYSFTPIYCAGYGDGCGPAFFDQDTFVEMTKTSVISWVEYLRGREGALEQVPAYSGEVTWTLTAATSP